MVILLLTIVKDFMTVSMEDYGARLHGFVQQEHSTRKVFKLVTMKQGLSVQASQTITHVLPTTLGCGLLMTAKAFIIAPVENYY